MNKIFYIMGKSSSGKDSIYKLLKKKYPEYKTITLYTTRPIRQGETEGVEYHFVTEKEFNKMKEEKKIIEYRTYDTKCGLWIYFTADDGQIDLENHNYLVIGTLQSFDAMCQYYGKNKVVPVYLEVEDGKRLQRALDREKQEDNPKYAEMCRRFLADSDDFSEENLKKAGIKKRFLNENLETCMKEIETYLDTIYSDKTMI